MKARGLELKKEGIIPQEKVVYKEEYIVEIERYPNTAPDRRSQAFPRP